ncbi:Myb-like DNA-binding domain containing protein [Tritrichomonas foetus]|uniref:Myb-like DNA-binding domain containing protein n=1 Tax=Tritrichomonas foetus TaxID=1144522 RepID=A0A1J4KIE0_9EUKA|nr:Myb-like DNA-binding domain containing protein [Tritrichomonas foetus]|eukprot:OHT10810.1 Myb-like DNA-binding domain containing protein [Tritrichomonas foetus]
MRGNKEKRLRRPFRPDEDEKLKTLVNEFGDQNWNFISQLMVDRNPRQCKDRWKNFLRSELYEPRKREWTQQEDRVIIEKFNEIGPQWKLMERFFNGRMQYDLRNRYLSLKKAFNRTIVNYIHCRKRKSLKHFTSDSKLAFNNESNITDEFTNNQNYKPVDDDFDEYDNDLNHIIDDQEFNLDFDFDFNDEYFIG